MKRLFVILSVLFFTGCSMLDISNTPTKKVEEYLNKYQILDKEVLDQLDSVIDRKTKLNDENKKEYRELIKKQYKDLQYSIKEERIDGDEAVVSAEVIVTDFTKVINEAEVYKRGHIEEFYNEEIYNANKSDLTFIIDTIKQLSDLVKTKTIHIIVSGKGNYRVQVLGEKEMAIDIKENNIEETREIEQVQEEVSNDDTLDETAIDEFLNNNIKTS